MQLENSFAEVPERTKEVIIENVTRLSNEQSDGIRRVEVKLMEKLRPVEEKFETVEKEFEMWRQAQKEEELEKERKKEELSKLPKNGNITEGQVQELLSRIEDKLLKEIDLVKYKTINK